MFRNLKVVRNIFLQFEQLLYVSFRRDPFPREFAFAYNNDVVEEYQFNKKFSIKDIIGDGFLLAVPKFRRTIERRWKRKYGTPEYHYKMLVPKTNILVCNKCGHNYESGVLCAHCYQKVQEETKEIQDKIQEALGNGKPIENDVIVLYEGEKVEAPNEMWNGKRIIEMKKNRPEWFSKNLLQKSTQEPSDSTDVKPIELA